MLEQKPRIVSRHRSGEAYQNMCETLKVPKTTVASILKWKKFGTTKTLPRAGSPAKLSNRGRRALVREVTKSSRVPLWRETSIRTPSLQHSINQAFVVDWPLFSKRHMTACLEITKGT